MADSLGRLVLDMGANVAGFQSDLGRVERLAKKTAADIKKSLLDVSIAGTTIGNILADSISAGTRALFEMAKNTVELGDQFQKLSQRTGVGVEALAGLKYAADLSDSSIEDLGKGLSKLNISIGQALRDDASKAAQAFRNLGINLKESIKGGTEQVFADIADAVQESGNAAKIAQDGVAVLGKGFINLIPTLSGGSEGLRVTSDEARKLGLVLSEETVAASARFNDALTTLQAAAQGFANSLAAEVLPALAQYAEILAKDAVENNNSAEAAKIFGNVLKGVGLAVVIVKNVVEGLVNAYAGLAAVQERLLSLDFKGAQAAASAALDGVKDSLGDIKTAYLAAFETTQKPLIIKGLKPLKAEDFIKPEAPKVVREVVAAVKVLNQVFLDSRKPVEDARNEFQKFAQGLNGNIKAQNELSASLEKLKKRYDEGGISLAEYNKLVALAKQKAGDLTSANNAQATSYSSVLRSINAEISLLKLSGSAREELERALQTEADIREAINDAQANGNKLTNDEIKNIETAVRARNKLRDPIKLDVIKSVGEALNEAFAQASASAGFAKFAKDIKKAFQGGAESIAAGTASLLSLTSDIVGAAQASDGNATGSGFRALTQTLSQLPGIVGSIATIALSIDKLTGGKLFGTDFSRAGSSSGISFGQAGPGGSSSVTDTRQRSLFRGTQTRVTTSALDAAALEQLGEFQRGLDVLQATLARAFAVELPGRVSASFAQTFDKDGKLLTTVATVAGRTVAAGTEQAFRQYLTAESILAAIRASAPTADQLADAYRGTGATLLEFAQFAAAAQADIVKKVGLLGDEGLGAILSVVEGLKLPGETLSGTYLRVADSANLLTDSLKGIGLVTSLTRTEFVKFSAVLVDALGGLQNAAAIISANINEFFSPSELDAFRLTNARTNLGAISQRTGITATGDEFKDLLRRALSGAFGPEETAAILEYGQALATVNNLTRTATEAAKESARLEAEAIDAANRARKESAAALFDFINGLNDQLDDQNLTDYQKKIKALNKSFKDNQAELTRLSIAAGLTAAPLDGVTANMQLLAQGSARALQSLRITVLQGLEKVFGSSSEPVTYFNFQSLTRDTRNWAQQLERLNKLQDAQDLARSLGDLFGPGGLEAGFAEFGLSFSEVLNSLGVNINDLTSPEKLAAFGKAAALLGVSAEELARLSGLDFESLTEEQKKIVRAGLASAKPIDLTEETNKLLGEQSTAQFDAAKRIEEIGLKQLNELQRAAQINEDLLSVADSTLIIQRDQANEIALLRGQFSSLTDEIRRTNNRPVGV